MTGVDRVKRFIRSRTPFIGSVTGVRTHEPLVILTFDDGPHPTGTEPVLDALAEFGATATFFVLTGRAERRPDLLARLLDGGHEVGLHGVDHRRLTTMSADEVFRRTRDGRRRLEDMCGREVRWFRPPYGRQSLSTFRAVRRAGLDPVVWTTSALDSSESTTAARLGHAMAGIRAGAVLLAHDGRADDSDGADDGPAPVVDRGALVRDILTRYRQLGLQGTSLGAALRTGHLERGYWFAR